MHLRGDFFHLRELKPELLQDHLFHLAGKCGARTLFFDFRLQELQEDLIELFVVTKHGSLQVGQGKDHAIGGLIEQRLTFENDDKSYTPSDLLPICNELEAPFVYDVHHHRCLKDTMLIQEVTEAALKTWNREPLFHISSPLEGWEGPKPQRHHDFINPDDFPDCWKSLSVTVEIEAKAKEVAIQKLQTALEHRSVKLWKATT